MKRTQLYIDESQFQLLSFISREKKTTISDLVRKALDKVYGGKKRKTKEMIKALHAAFGIWKNRTDLPPTDEYIRALRKGTRMKRFGLE